MAEITTDVNITASLGERGPKGNKGDKGDPGFISMEIIDGCLYIQQNSLITLSIEDGCLKMEVNE